MAKKDPVPNKRFWRARQRLNLSRSQLAEAANGAPVLRTCEHGRMTENYIGRIEQGRIGGGMCDERRAALCERLEVAYPADIGLVAERQLPTRSAPARPRRTRLDTGSLAMANGALGEDLTASTVPAGSVSPPLMADSGSELPEDWWTTEDVLAFLRLVGVPISRVTWAAYVSRRQAPAPNRMFGRSPAWRPKVIREWQASRPRRGSLEAAPDIDPAPSS